MESLRQSIDKGIGLLTKARYNKRELKDDLYILGLLEHLSVAIYQEIHSYLFQMKTHEAEDEIRELVKDTASRVLPIARSKMTILAKTTRLTDKGLAEIKDKSKRDYAQRMIITWDRLLSICACRSFAHFVEYLEGEMLGSPLYSTAPKDLFSGLMYYLTDMVMNENVNFLEKQMPTGYGKTVSDGFFIPFIFGNDIDTDVIKIFGNRANVVSGMKFITSVMCLPRYADVFPYFKQFDGEERKVFENISTGLGEFKIAGSKNARNFLILNKDTKISGARAKWLFLDDITQAEDRNNPRQHKWDIDTFKNVWFKRNYDLNTFKIIASGTTYSEHDILSYLKKNLGFSDSKPHTQYPYTHITKSNSYIRESGTSVFISIPKLTAEDKSTYPRKFPATKAIQERADDYDTFMAMEQQQPQPPDGTPFNEKKIKIYTQLPAHPKGITPLVMASLDPARTGKNYVTMPILEYSNRYHYLKDILYEKKSMDDMYPYIIEKIAHHRITRLHIENNTDTSLRALLEGKLKERGINYCTMTEVYSTGIKEERIYKAQAAILQNIVFPINGMYARSSPMGKARHELITYSYDVKNESDDFVDALALYVEQFVLNSQISKGPQYINIRGGRR